MIWRIRLAERAEKDLERILSRSADTFGAAQAETYERTLKLAIDALIDGPEVPGSSSRDDLLPGLRSLRVARHGRRGRHLILYRVSAETTIDVLRILHDAMDLPRHVPRV